MPKKRFSAEQADMRLLRQIEVATTQGKTISFACRDAGISSNIRDLVRGIRTPA